MLGSVAPASSSLLAIDELGWRASAAHHRERVRKMLRPGFLHDDRSTLESHHDQWRALDPQHPVFNFLIEYYCLKGAKSTRRLGRWSPPLADKGTLLAGATAADVDAGYLSARGATFSAAGVTYEPRAQSYSRAQASSFVWYKELLDGTSNAEPVLHCYGLHEWAMQYQPAGAPPPPSAKYQQHLPLRVSRATLNAAVERRGISCTHVDALRYFSPAAAPLNKHGATLVRAQQPLLEQPACVHAAMDLLKIALKLHPWLPAELLGDALEVAIEARYLDVAASPYDLASYGLAPVRVETEEGRREYRQRQIELMNRATPIRSRLLNCYEEFLEACVDVSTVEAALNTPNSVQFATATPGGPAWRWSEHAAESSV